MKLDTTVGGELFEGAPTGVDWTVGDATTVWFVVFNEPGECANRGVWRGRRLRPSGALEDRCAPRTRQVANAGAIEAVARLREGDTSAAAFGDGLAETTEIHLVGRSHGPADSLTGRQLSSALHSLEGGCETNTCGDAQFAVFLAP